MNALFTCTPSDPGGRRRKMHMTRKRQYDRSEGRVVAAADPLFSLAHRAATNAVFKSQAA